jgi:poly(hydroxyalkanoate) granule-associated protein
MAKKVEEMSEEVVVKVEEVSETAADEVEELSEGAAEKLDAVAEAWDEPEQNPLFGMAHRVLLAAVGAAALTKEEVENFVEKLVERGEIAEKDGKKLMRDVMARRKKEAKKAEDQLESRLEELLGRMSVPSKGDIDALSAKITELSKKVDELKKA